MLPKKHRYPLTPTPFGPKPTAKTRTERCTPMQSPRPLPPLPPTSPPIPLSPSPESPPLPHSPPMPHMPLDPVTWCDPRNYDARGQRLEGPCLYGLAWWIWLLLILGFCCCLVPVIWKVRASHKVGITPGRVVSFWEAVMLAVRRTGLEPQPSRLKIDLPLSRASPALDRQPCACSTTDQ